MNNLVTYFKIFIVTIVLFVGFSSYDTVYAYDTCSSSMSCTTAATCTIDCGVTYVGSVTIVPGCTTGFTADYSYNWSLTVNGNPLTGTKNCVAVTPSCSWTLSSYDAAQACYPSDTYLRSPLPACTNSNVNQVFWACSGAIVSEALCECSGVPTPSVCATGWSEEVLSFDGVVGSGPGWCDGTSWGACASGTTDGSHDPSVKGSITTCCRGAGTLGYIRNCGLPPSVDGACGSVSGTIVSSLLLGSATENLCSSATPTVTSGSFSGTGPWSWTCDGVNSGSKSPTCNASKTAATTHMCTNTATGNTNLEYPIATTCPTWTPYCDSVSSPRHVWYHDSYWPNSPGAGYDGPYGSCADAECNITSYQACKTGTLKAGSSSTSGGSGSWTCSGVNYGADASCTASCSNGGNNYPTCTSPTYTCGGTDPGTTGITKNSTATGADQNWTYDGVGTSACTYKCATDYVRNTGNTACVPVTYTLTVTPNPIGAGTASGTGIYNAGATAKPSATEASGYTFSNWTGSTGCNGSTTASINIVMDSNKTCTANFTLNSTYSCKNFISNSTAWNSTVPASDTNYSITSNTGAACTAYCNSYNHASGTTACNLNICQGGPLDSTQTVWPNDDINLADNTTSYSYSSSDTGARCQYHCATNYERNAGNTACVAVTTLTATISGISPILYNTAPSLTLDSSGATSCGLGYFDINILWQSSIITPNTTIYPTVAAITANRTYYFQCDNGVVASGWKSVTIAVCASGQTLVGGVCTNVTPVTGVCGTVTTASSLASNSANLCSTSTPTVTSGSFSGTGPWSWTCDGVNNGGKSPLCTAIKGCGTDCSATKASTICSGQSFSNGCGGTCPITGTRVCGSSWKEVVP